jgi:hypothetical protein
VVDVPPDVPGSVTVTVSVCVTVVVTVVGTVTVTGSDATDSSADAAAVTTLVTVTGSRARTNFHRLRLEHALHLTAGRPNTDERAQSKHQQSTGHPDRRPEPLSTNHPTRGNTPGSGPGAPPRPGWCRDTMIGEDSARFRDRSGADMTQRPGGCSTG